MTFSRKPGRKTGRKAGFTMPRWQKSLQAQARRDAQGRAFTANLFSLLPLVAADCPDVVKITTPSPLHPVIWLADGHCLDAIDFYRGILQTRIAAPKHVRDALSDVFRNTIVTTRRR